MSDEGDDGFDEADAPPVPWTVRAAGTIWLALGVLALAVAGIVALYVAVCVIAGKPASCITPLAGLGLLAGIGAGGAGGKARRGELTDPLPSGLGSIAFGLALWLLAAAWATVAVNLLGPARGWADILALLTPVGLGGLMVAAGALAVGGRRSYLTWKSELDDSDALRRIEVAAPEQYRKWAAMGDPPDNAAADGPDGGEE